MRLQVFIPPAGLDLHRLWSDVQQTCDWLLVFVSRTRRDRSVTAPSPRPTTAAPWASSSCTTSPMRSPSTPSRTGEWLLRSVSVFVSHARFQIKLLKCVFRATQIKTYSWDNAQVIMVGNKCDMDEERVVPPEKGKHLADQLGETCWEILFSSAFRC